MTYVIKIDISPSDFNPNSVEHRRKLLEAFKVSDKLETPTGAGLRKRITGRTNDRLGETHRVAERVQERA
jgi:hypothetical protein